MLNNLPPELLVNVLSRLPLKNIGQCTCVSKSWESLITSPTFITTHLSLSLENSSNNPPLVILRRWSDKNGVGSPKKEHYSLHFDSESFPKYQDLYFPFQSLNFHLRIVGSCNGVVCLSDNIGIYTCTFILWNPSINKYLFLPSPIVTYTTNGPSKFSIGLGFGFDSCSNDYKVVRLSFIDNDCGIYKAPPIVEVYSLNTGFWRIISAKAPSLEISGLHYTQAFVHGAVHWLGTRMNKKGFSNVTLLFDMGNEAIRTMKLPDSLLATSSMCLSIAVFGGSLSVLCIDNYMWGVEACSIWVMQEYGNAESWTKQYNVIWGLKPGKVIGLRANDDLLLALKNGSFSLETELISYNHKSQEINSLGIHGKGYSYYVDNYTESLVLLKEGKGCMKVEDGIENAEIGIKK
ncbi:F-box domain-containing protein [Cephalotus follicularis]|uniref:F-box domain-containing protein n=1 Tax=Cephalotus follicularis TaxID=3775 RepID=A0A1Q3CQC0_CEPFO|nr:F-box domain-containing protein [Cephalotus follicularis]